MAAQSSLILAIESSCDETAAAVVANGTEVRSNIIATQHELHETYAGVVPEIASRAHLERIQPVVRDALSTAGVTLDDIDAVASSVHPGLIGSLLVGMSFAKAIAFARKKPFIGVDHVHAHLLSGLLEAEPVAWPALGLVVSGGHTSLYAMTGPLDISLLGRTIDDAAGEAFDKAATILGIPWPGGPQLDALAEEACDAGSMDLPVSLMRGDSMDFSFSGVKTAFLYATLGTPRRENGRVVYDRTAEALSHAEKVNCAASFRCAVVRALIRKTRIALKQFDVKTILAGGGVVANRLLRRELETLAHEHNIELRLPHMTYCMDNAAMIGALAHERFIRGDFDSLATTARPTAKFSDRGRAS